MGKTVITSSEMGRYNFCSLAWYLRRLDAPISKEVRGVMEKRMSHGEEIHERHFGKARRIEVKEKASAYLAVLLVLVVLLSLLGWV